jgi:hypothetical protein
VPKLKYIKYVLAVTVLFALIPLKVQAAPIIHFEVSDSNLYSGTFSTDNTSLPYQFTVSSTDGSKLQSLTLYKKVGDVYIAEFTHYNVNYLKLEMMLDKNAEYILAATGGSINDPIDVDVSQVPIPSSIILFGTSLIGLIGLRRRQKNASFSICNNSSTNGSDRTIPTAN